MSVAVFAAPYTPPPPKYNPWTHNLHTWTGWDGSVWDICTGVSGVSLLAGVEGMLEPPIIHYTADSPAVYGAFWRGWTAEKRDVLWPLEVFHDGGSIDWIQLNRRFRRSLHPGKAGRWSIQQPDGQVRSLTMRFSGNGSQGFDMAPELFGWADYAITFQAVDPFWYGQPVTQTFQGPEQKLFFGGGNPGDAESAPPFYISRGSSFATASISNDGDVEAWPVWTVQGPCTTATVGVGASTITIPVTLSAGQSITLDTDPRVQQAFRENGTEVTAALTTVAFAPIPEGEARPLNVTMTGTGTVSATITPRFLTAY